PGDAGRGRPGPALTTTPEANARIFWSLYLSTILTAEHSERILSELLHSSYDIHEMARIPRTDRIAQKYAGFYQGAEKYLHSCGILYVQDSRIFYCIMTQGLEQAEARDLIGSVLYEVWSYVSAFHSDGVRKRS
ncbi:MAG: hypothetical protein HY042_00505, partial [Spirochaetia bacterium]|nr:hypothetical protein [Spirochaetia bacterium]